MKRVLCVRFLNWPVQRLRRQLHSADHPAAADHRSAADHRATGTDQSATQTVHSPLAVCTAAQPASTSPATSRRRRVSIEETELKFVRTIFPAARTGPAVIAVSEDAWAMGVRPGMPLAEARSMARPIIRPGNRPGTREGTRPGKGRVSLKKPAPPEVCFMEWQPWEDRMQLQGAAELLRQFSPLIGIDEMPVPDSLLLDITGCAPLFGGESALAEHLLYVLRQAGYRCHACVADFVAAAWAFTHATGHGLLPSVRLPAAKKHSSSRQNAVDAGTPSVLIIPPGQATDYLADLPLAAGRLHPADIDVLAQLGLGSLRQLLQLPREDLPSRLSSEAVIRVQQLTGLTLEPVRGIPEANPVVAEWSSEFPATNLDELRQVLEYLSAQIVAELLRRKTGCIRLSCQLFNASADQSLQLVAEVVRPTQSSELLNEVLGLRLENLPLTDSICRVQMRASTAPLPVAKQRDLFSDTEHVVPQDELATLVNRLNGRLGPQAITTMQQHPDARPEFAYRRVPLLNSQENDQPSQSLNEILFQLVTPQPDGNSTPPAGWNRPIRLLPVPFLLPRPEQGSPMQFGFIWQGQRFQPETISGPERLQTAWWSDQPVSRDYYRVQTTTGSQFWIYRDLQTSDWFLHGIFD